MIDDMKTLTRSRGRSTLTRRDDDMKTTTTTSKPRMLERMEADVLAGLPDTVHRRPSYGTWLAAIIVVIGFGMWVHLMAVNPRLDWPTVGQYLFDARIFEGLRNTLVLAIVAFVLAMCLGLIAGLGRVSSNPLIRTVAMLYVWVFRGIPALIQILFWGNLALFLPVLGIGLPGMDPIISVETNRVVTTFVASVIALTLLNGAYLAEIVRAGIISVDKGQREASEALGLTRWQMNRRVVIPQAVRVIVPPSGSQLIVCFKETALVSVIAGGGILTSAQHISLTNYRIVELLIVAALWYLAVTSVSYGLQRVLERRLERSR